MVDYDELDRVIDTDDKKVRKQFESEVDIGAGIRVDKKGVQRAVRDIMDMTPPILEYVKLVLLGVILFLCLVNLRGVF